MTPTLYPPARFLPVRNTSGLMTAPTRGLIIHVQVGNGSLYGWFNNAASGVSAHMWLSKTGAFEQYVPFDRRAWAQKAGNTAWISVETEGHESEDYTPVQVQRLGEFYAWGMREMGWLAQITDSPTGYGIGTHRMGGSAWGAHACPGDLRAGRRGDILAAATTALQEDTLNDEQMETLAAFVSSRIRFDLLREIRYAKSGGRILTDMQFGSAAEALGIGVLGTQELRDGVDALQKAVAQLVAGDTQGAATPLTVDRMLSAIRSATDMKALAAFVEAAAARLRQLHANQSSGS